MKIVLIEPLGITKSSLESIVAKCDLLDHELVIYDHKPVNQTDLIERASQAEIMVTVNEPISAEVIEKCHSLKMISIAFTGYDHVDLAACKASHVTATNAAGYATNSVAELTIGLIIDLLRNVVIADHKTRIGETRVGIIGNQLKGKNIGIIGAGAIGTKVAELAVAFGCKVFYYSRTKKTKLTKIGAKYLPLTKLLKISDIITIHVPLTMETKNLIRTKELALMKPTAFLIQTSRGGVVNEADLTEALNKNVIAGAGIDVFETEPPLNLDQPLLMAKNTLLTPHVAFATKEALEARAKIAFTNIKNWLADKPKNIVG
ncbi:MAG TPA: hydroxyacid dehydrogenase [Candidatus Pacebacteria bacterium]|nr:hydroxyacid dehydrogenase [Candidatus Paceibacterota bacterium]